MKKKISLILSLFVITFSFSQTENELYKTGITNFKTEKYNESILNFTELLQLVKGIDKQKVCYINRGLSYDKIGKYDEAIKDFDEAIKLDKTDYSSYIDRGLSKMHAEFFEQAIIDFNKVYSECEIKEKKEAALYWTIRINFQQKLYKLVVENCNNYLNINQNDSEIYFILGCGNEKLENFEKALINYTKAIELNPDYYQAIANRGSTKISILTSKGNLQPTKKQLESACEDFQKAMSLGDNNENTKMNYKKFCDK